MSMSIDAMAAQLNNISDVNNNSKLKKTLESDMKNKNDEELMEVCKEFEAYFTEQVFKAMEKTIPSHEESDASMNQMKDYFKEELIKQYAEKSAEGSGLGIAKMMYEQMKRNYDI